MIVYGDPSFEAPLSGLVERLRTRLDAPSTTPDGARALLIEAGVLEQAVADGLSEGTPEIVTHCQALTDVAATRFLATLDGASVEEFLTQIEEALARLPALQTTLAVKPPEGYAFYALYPESYRAAARRWLSDHPSPGRVAVVGVRSIGTSLSAVVLATLRSEGIDAERFTVRPTGHPFAREVTLPRLDADHALIVDEGPGLSGSSMAAVAEAARLAGVRHIALFPGHAGEPGAQASERVRTIWATTLRYVESAKSPLDALAEATSRLCSAPIELVEDLGGGRWREVVFPATPWPAVALPFERPKFRVTPRGGAPVLWKFVGLIAEGTTLGYAPRPWIDGEPLTPADATPFLLTQIARHIADVAGSPLTSEEVGRSYERLVDMLGHNAYEALGRTPALPSPGGEGSGSAGDYRLAPHEWRRVSDGTVVKTNRRPQSGDHTVVGIQSIAWDVAGAIVEWDLDEADTGTFLDALRVEGIVVGDLPFYEAAYTAFRMGLCAHCAGGSPEEERARLAAAEAFYRARLVGALENRLH